MIIYVYQIDDHHYGAGLSEKVCRRRGRIVEHLACDTVERADYLIRRGANFTGVYERVVELAELCKWRLENGYSERLPTDTDTIESVWVDLISMPLSKRIKTGINLMLRRDPCCYDD